MSDPPKSTPSFSFGQTSTSGSASGSLFGTTTPTQGSTGLFGSLSQNNQSTTPGSGLFGNAPTQKTPGTSAPGLFGGATSNAQSSVFGSGSTSNTFGSAGGLFGQKPSGTSQSSGFTFGKKPEEGSVQNTAANTGTNQSGTPTTPGQGLNAAAPSGASSFSGFGTPGTLKPSSLFSPNASTTPAGPPPATSAGGTSLFGSTFGTPQQNTSNLFGQNKQQSGNAPTSSTGLFSATTPSGTSNLFGAKPADNQQTSSGSSGMFGAKPAENQPASTSSGTAPSSSTQQASSTNPSSQPSGGLFGGMSTAQSGQSTPAFGTLGSTQQAQSSKGGFGFLGASSTASQPPASQPAASAPTSNLFSGLGGAQSTTSTTSSAAPTSGLFSGTTGTPAGTPASTAAPASTAPSTGLFGFGQKKDDAATSSAPASSTPASTSTAAPSTNLFGSLITNKNTGTTTTSATAPTTTTATAPSTFTGTGPTPVPAPKDLNASTTTGPAPPASSRLKNKSMDDIITRWAADLAAHQRTFQSQASQIAAWDRTLADSADRIGGLYARTFRAERDAAEVDRQLAGLEAAQDELAAWLDRYEAEVEELGGGKRRGGAGAGVGQQEGGGAGGQGGPDAEREKMYVLAEGLSERLVEMGKELGTMIEDVNAVGGQLSRTSRPDDPLSQIVRVLNSHLFSLQQIDQGASQLQAKVAAAQKDSQRLGANGYHGVGANSSDDFYRSWMGSRR
ncbi:MAG: FG-nucleoporin nsp1 [Bathelium mastoideum]|nr:MAG: FG-nucleoporin nsp1 [Bathelium mastoideum]